MKPFFSVIIPTYNRESVLPRAVESVLAQSYQSFELIIVDDGSTDKTFQYLQGLKDPKVRLIALKNGGVSRARNEGVRISQGEWIAFLDSDDEWLAEKLNIQYRFIQEHPDYKIHHGEEIWIRNGKRVNPMKKHQKSGGDQFLPSLKLCLISPSTVVLRRDLYESLGGFREDYPVCEDYDLWLRILKDHSVGFSREFLIKKYGGHEDQLSRKYFAMDYWRVKTLVALLKEKELSSEREEELRSVLAFKIKVLIQGYSKHQNFVRLKEIQQIKKELFL